MEFQNREDAGRQLVTVLGRFKDEHAVVLALPRGGVVVGAEVARELHLPFGVVLVRKIGHPMDPEFAIGAVSEDEPPLYNDLATIGVDHTWMKLEEEAAAELLERRRQLYFDGGHVRPAIAGYDVIIVDDGIATGMTILAAIRWARSHGATNVIIAAPIGSRPAVEMLSREADAVCILGNPEEFRGSVGAHYYEFGQVDDLRVRQLLRTAMATPEGTIFLL